MILISQLHNEDRLNGTLTNLQRGPNPSKIKVYSAGAGPARPAAITDAPVGTLLCTITLDDPPGAVLDNKLTLTLPDDALVLADGQARWARVEDGNGAASIDCDVSNAAGSGELKLQTIDLLAGGAVRLISAEFG
jgi:hypothetical protein